MHKRAIHTAAVFSFGIYCIIFITTIVGCSLVGCMLHLGLVTIEHYELIMVISFFTSAIIGILLSLTIGRKSIKLIETINEAIRQVAKGNYEVTLDESSAILELREIAKNFNQMARELAGTEMLRSDFVENVSHEFKTPLTAIDGYATLLQQKKLSEQKRMEYTQKILFSTRRLNRLTGNILLLSRLEHQELEIKKERYSLDEQIRECILLLEPIWSGKQMNLCVELEDCCYNANRELLAQVWQNILCNAVKFTPDHGTICVTLERNTQAYVVGISDNGSGMDAVVKARIFEKFYQGDTSRSSAGNGLGLSLVKRILDLHGGSITVESQAGVGSRFIVTLPFTQY